MAERQAALVTGSAIRLGKSIAMALAKNNYDIAIHYNSSQESAEKTAQEIRELGVECDIFQQDLRNIAGLEGLVQRVQDRFPNFSILVNSASAYDQATISGTSSDLFDAQMIINFKAPFFLSQAFASLCKKGNIINIIDNKVGFNQFHYAAYLLSKKSLAEFTKMAAIEFSPQIRVNGIAPGVIMPGETRTAEYIEWRARQIPLKVTGDSENITKAIHYILDNDFVTGQILTVDGGENTAFVGPNYGVYETIENED